METSMIYVISTTAVLVFIISGTVYARYRVKIFRKLAYFDIKREDVLHIKEHFSFYEGLSPLLREFYFLEIGSLMKKIVLTDAQGTHIDRSSRLLLCASIAKLTYGMKINRVRIPTNWVLADDKLNDKNGNQVDWKWQNKNGVTFSGQVFHDEIETRSIEKGLLLDIIIDVLFKEDQQKNIFHFHQFICTADIVKARKVLKWITNPKTEHFEKKCFRKYFNDPDALRNNYPVLYKKMDTTFSAQIAA